MPPFALPNNYFLPQHGMYVGGNCMGGLFPHPIYVTPFGVCLINDTVDDPENFQPRPETPPIRRCQCTAPNTEFDSTTGVLTLSTPNGDPVTVDLSSLAANSMDPSTIDFSALTPEQVADLAELLAAEGIGLTDLFNVDLGQLLPTP